MQPLDFETVLDQIVDKDPRFRREAYLFLREALDYTQKAISQANKGRFRHISGQELLAGIRAWALQQYGPMALAVLQEWGLHRCEDFGELVFALVDAGVLSKTDTDSRADFANGFDFEEAFRKPFLPTRPAGARSAGPAPSPQADPASGR